MESHTVGVIGQRLAAVHNQVMLFVESDRFFAEQIDNFSASDLFESVVDRAGVYRFRQIAFEAQQYRLVATMTFTGCAQ